MAKAKTLPPPDSKRWPRWKALATNQQSALLHLGSRQLDRARPPNQIHIITLSALRDAEFRRSCLGIIDSAFSERICLGESMTLSCQRDVGMHFPST